MNFIQDLYNTFSKNKNNRAFCIEGKDFSYGDFLQYINGTQELLEGSLHGKNNPVGIICRENIETYASIFAAWFSGNYFVPLNPKHPAERNRAIIKNTGIRYILSSVEEGSDFIDSEGETELLFNSGVKSESGKIPEEFQPDLRMYVLTTSGSTGTPKFVPINQENIAAYCEGFLERFPEMNSDVSFLQIYDLTVDASFTSYLVPLSIGACVYSLPEGPFKFLTIAKMLANQEVNWVKLTPSVLSFLSPHKSRLDFKHLKGIILGGEALPLSLIKEWHPVFPNAIIANHYGPTEASVGVTTYRISDIKNIHSMGGVVTIGKPLKEVNCVVLNERGIESAIDEKGELCISGKQVMTGYLNGDDSSFIYLEGSKGLKKYYKTGDIVQIDKEGFIYYSGRTDDQVKIEGHRMNLIEIENKVRDFLPGHKVVMLAFEKIPGVKRLYLFVEGMEINTAQLKNKLAEQLPPMMVPKEIFTISKIPLTTGGKTDKKSLANEYLLNSK